MKRNRLPCYVLLALLLRAGQTHALDVRTEGDRLTVHAHRIPLQDVPARIACLGAKVRIEPEINPVVSASFDDRDIQKGPASILRSTNHALLLNIKQ